MDSLINDSLSKKIFRDSVYQDDQHDEVVKEFLGDNPMNQLTDAEKWHSVKL